MTTRTKRYTRISGESIDVTITVDVDRLIDVIAQRMALHGRTTAAFIGGSITADIEKVVT